MRIVDRNILTTLNLQSFHHCWDIDVMETLKIPLLPNMFHDRLCVIVMFYCVIQAHQH